MELTPTTASAQITPQTPTTVEQEAPNEPQPLSPSDETDQFLAENNIPQVDEAYDGAFLNFTDGGNASEVLQASNDDYGRIISDHVYGLESAGVVPFEGVTDGVIDVVIFDDMQSDNRHPVFLTEAFLETLEAYGVVAEDIQFDEDKIYNGEDEELYYLEFNTVDGRPVRVWYAQYIYERERLFALEQRASEELGTTVDMDITIHSYSTTNSGYENSTLVGRIGDFIAELSRKRSIHELAQWGDVIPLTASGNDGNVLPEDNSIWNKNTVNSSTRWTGVFTIAGYSIDGYDNLNVHVDARSDLDGIILDDGPHAATSYGPPIWAAATVKWLLENDYQNPWGFPEEFEEVEPPLPDGY